VASVDQLLNELFTCGRVVKLKGGFYYALATAQRDYTCFYCNKPIRAGSLYVEERAGIVRRRYHTQCVEKHVPRIFYRESPSGGVLCTW
jgi:hypothetical protein